MRDFEDMEYSDIAETLKTSVGGAKLRVLRARRALKEKLAPLFEDDKK
jgi:RNA polymerase sigma-70 factor (ECF subfamily)